MHRDRPTSRVLLTVLTTLALLSVPGAAHADVTDRPICVGALGYYIHCLP